MTRMAGLRILAALTGAFLATATLAQTAAIDLKTEVEQKEALVRRVLEDSPASRRIAGSSDAQARSFLAAAAEQHRNAVASIKSGDLKSASRLLDDAMWSAGRARQLVPDPSSRAIGDRVEYARVVASVQALRASYLRHLPRAQGAARGKGATVAERDADLERVDALIEDANSLANAESFAQAIRAVQHAEIGLVNGLTRLLGSSTLMYALKFETLQEEYAYELDRNRSYEELVPVALTERRPSSDVIRNVGRFVARNQTLREQAQSQALRKDFRTALRSLRAGTEQLQRALADTGIIVPTEMPPLTK